LKRARYDVLTARCNRDMLSWHFYFDNILTNLFPDSATRLFFVTCRRLLTDDAELILIATNWKLNRFVPFQSFKMVWYGILGFNVPLDTV